MKNAQFANKDIILVEMTYAEYKPLADKLMEDDANDDSSCLERMVGKDVLGDPTELIRCVEYDLATESIYLFFTGNTLEINKQFALEGLVNNDLLEDLGAPLVGLLQTIL